MRSACRRSLASLVSALPPFVLRSLPDSRFLQVHMQLEEKRKTASNPSHLQAEVSQLELEKEQLTSKLEKLRARIANDAESVSYTHLTLPTKRIV